MCIKVFVLHVAAHLRILLYLFADDPNLPRLTISHLQLIRYGNHASNEQDLRLLQCLATKWKRVGEILGLHRAVIQNIEKPGSGSSPEDCIHEVFVKWLDNAPQLKYPLTWRGLYNLLLASEHGEAANELTVALSSHFNTVVEAASKFSVNIELNYIFTSRPYDSEPITVQKTVSEM